MSASGCGLNRPLAVLHEGQLWVVFCLSRRAANGPECVKTLAGLIVLEHRRSLAERSHGTAAGRIGKRPEPRQRCFTASLMGQNQPFLRRQRLH